MALGVAPSELGVDQSELGGPDESECDMRRRKMLAAVAGAGVSTAAPAGPGAALAWGQALFHPAPGTMTVEETETGLRRVAHLMCESRYREAAETVPKLIAAAEYRAERGGPAEATRLSRAYALATSVSTKERRDIGWITADRAVQAARRSGHPLAHATAARAQYVILRQRGHHEWARQLADTTVSELEHEELARPVVGHLLLEASYGAAQAGKAADADTLWERAKDMADRGPHETVWPDLSGPFTTCQVERYGLCIRHLQGDVAGALGHLSTLNKTQTTTPECRARIRHDAAKLYKDMGDLPRALRLLKQAEEETPEDVRRQTVRRMVGEMVALSPGLPGLRGFSSLIAA